MTGSFFVPHDIEAPLRGAATGPLAGLIAVVKDMYDIAGSRTGGGSPDWLARMAAGAASRGRGGEHPCGRRDDNRQDHLR